VSPVTATSGVPTTKETVVTPRQLSGRQRDADPPPHVAIVVLNLPAERDRRVIRECRALEAAGYRVTVVCPRGTVGLTVVPGTAGTAIRSFRQPFAGSGILSFGVEFVWSFLCVAWHLLALTTRHRLVAAQVCNPPDVFWPLALLMRATGRPWIFDHHDLCPELYECKPGRTRPSVLRLLKFLERRSMRTASAVISTNESYREIALTRGGCPPEKVTVVRNGPALGEVAAPAQPSLVRRIVYLGVINPQDSVDIAVRAAAHLVELRGSSGWELVVAGDGECLADLRGLADQLDLNGVVRFTGWLNAVEVDEVLRGATIGIQPDPPTAMAELSTMAKTIEYLARGIPVVSVDLRESRRSAGDAAVYVPTGTPEEFAKSLDALLDDEVALSTMSRVALERFQTVLAWEHQAEAYVKVWRSLVPLTGAVAPVSAAPREEQLHR
jgi:glycosyltransferase involved in cell wall biosynthesis